jgi:hypothetical protein
VICVVGRFGGHRVVITGLEWRSVHVDPRVDRWLHSQVAGQASSLNSFALHFSLNPLSLSPSLSFDSHVAAKHDYDFWSAFVVLFSVGLIFQSSFAWLAFCIHQFDLHLRLVCLAPTHALSLNTKQTALIRSKTKTDLVGQIRLFLFATAENFFVHLSHFHTQHEHLHSPPYAPFTRPTNQSTPTHFIIRVQVMIGLRQLSRIYLNKDNLQQ